MLKRYIATTQLRICVGSRSFAFETYDNGQSIYETSDEAEQQMIESHQEFRLTFDLDHTLEAQQRKVVEEQQRRQAEIEEKRRKLEEENIKKQMEHYAEMNRASSVVEEAPAENTPTQEIEITDDGFTIVEAQSVTDAKDYMKTHFGIPKSRMMKMNDLLDKAQEMKVKFVGKDFKA